LKLAKVGLEDVFPCGAFSIGERSRADIVRRAIASAASGYGSRFEAVVLFGDGPWDLVSAVEAGISFVGINEGERGRERLRDAGARWVFADYADAEVIEQAVRRACAT
jgi:phosphoglycolate phosphatase-like HAD superfamily hydrolase